MLATYLAPATETALTSDSPPGFLLLWRRYSAHLAFVFLLLAFSASTLKAVVSNAQTRGLVGYRRRIGLGFATAHTFHLVALILFLSNLEGYRVDASVAVAGFGYVVTAMLALTSNDYSVRRLSPAKGRQLHTVGISILMGIILGNSLPSLFTTIASFELHNVNFVIAVLIYTIAAQKYAYIALCPLIGYAFAWVGHFIFEKNRPATFTYPFYSFVSDFIMWYQVLTRKIGLGKKGYTKS